ncbi:hypothetical protein LINPERHAP2_LOCUS24256 [Linum perenne]
MRVGKLLTLMGRV